MPITYPRPLPAGFYLTDLSFRIDRGQVISRTRGGLVQASDRARPLWSVRGTTAIRMPEQFDALLAFLDSLRGSVNAFYMHNIGRERPIAYPGEGWAGFTRHGGAGFDGTATVTVAAGYGVTIANLPSQYVVSEGDMISWPWRSSRTLHRVVQGGAAINGVVSVQVEPDVPAGGTLPQTVQLEKAQGVFRLLDDDKREPTYRPGFGDGFAFQAIQSLY